MRYFGFQNVEALLNRSFDGRNSIVMERLMFRDHAGRLYRTNSFLRTDGGSIPRLDLIGTILMALGWISSYFTAWSTALSALGLIICLGGVWIKFYGREWWSFIFHDALFKNQVEISDDDGKTWHPRAFNESKSNALLHEAMESQDAHRLKHAIIWIALHWFGWRAFNEDRKRLSTK